MKLIRDHTPDLLPNSTRPAYNHEEFLLLLRLKLVEEASEVAASTSTEEFISEMADLWEVFQENLKWKHVSLEMIIQVARAKKDKKGGYDERKVLFFDPPENKHK